MADPDEYERRYMDADRAVMVARTRPRPGPRLALLALLVGVIALSVPRLVFIVSRLWELRHESPAILVAIVGLVVMFVLPLLGGLFFDFIDAVTRVVLTPTHLRVHRGLATTDVPLGAITRVAVERTERWFPKLPAFGGFAPRDVVYQSFRTKESLRVEWRDEQGRARRVWVYLDEAEALRERVAALRASRTGVRVDVAEDTADDEAVGPVGEATTTARAPRSGREG